MDLQEGDRVISIREDLPGLSAGEYGTFVGYDRYGGYLNIEWDDFNPHRHDGDGLVKDGHGWFVDEMYVTILGPDDLGELPECDEESSSILFGL